MHRFRVAAALAVAAMLVLPAAPAAAKEAPLRSVRACGLTGCVRLSGAGVLRAVRHALRGPGQGDARFGPYYRLELRPALNQPQLDFYLPLSRRIQVNGESVAVGSAVAARLRAELGRQQPIPPRVTSVTVGGRGAAEPGAYTTMLYGTRVHPPAGVWSRPDVLIEVGFAEARTTPWADWGGAEYFPSVRLLHVPDGTWVRVGAGQAAMIAADRHGRRPQTGGGSDLTPLVLVLVGLAAVGLLVLRLRPRRRERVA
jgi:hypothetical protein